MKRFVEIPKGNNPDVRDELRNRGPMRHPTATIWRWIVEVIKLLVATGVGSASLVRQGYLTLKISRATAVPRTARGFAVDDALTGKAAVIAAELTRKR